jgi:hypothetical protein
MAIAATEKILTLDYWKRADKLVEGDYIFDREGKLRQVTLVQHFQSKCHRIVLSDWMEVTGNGALHFLLETPKYRSRIQKYKGKRQFRRPLVLAPVAELLDKPLRHTQNKHYFSIPTCGALKLPHQDLPVPAFVFGYWYWNRIRPNVMVANEINAEEVLARFRSHGYEIIAPKKRAAGGVTFSVFPTIESQFAPFIPREIPNNYLLASEEQRLELLSGVINARPRQYKKKGDNFRINSSVWLEIRKMQALVESLGCKTSLSFNEQRKYYTLSFKIRHKVCSHQESPPIKVHQSRRYIKQIEELPLQQCVHIETNGPDGSFLVGEGFITCR